MSTHKVNELKVNDGIRYASPQQVLSNSSKFNGH